MPEIETTTDVYLTIFKHLLQYFNSVLAASAFIRKRLNIGNSNIDVAVILGSGHKALAYDIDGPQIIIPYIEIPYFPIPTNIGHNRELVFGNIHGKSTIMFAGRIHLFEGYRSYYHAWLGTLTALLGCQLLISSNSCGAVVTDLKVGDFMIISDHMNCSSLPFFNGNYFKIRNPNSAFN